MMFTALIMNPDYYVVLLYRSATKCKEYSDLCY